MKAIRYHGPGDIRPEEVPIPDCGVDEIRVRVDACAVCGTDLKAWKVGNPRIEAPQVMGHEFTGLVEALGADVNGFATGDRIVMATSISCGGCAYCRRGWPNLCLDLAPVGFAYPGGMAEYVTIPARALAQGHVVKIPGDVEAAHAALAEPISCTINAARNCGIEQADTVLVMGAGPMGIMNACTARCFRASRIIMTEVNPIRLAAARGFGFDVLVDPTSEDLLRIVNDQTGGLGVDVVIVAAPAALPQQQAVTLVRKRGTVCLFASLPIENNTIALDSRVIHYGELRVVGTSDSTPADVEQAVQWLVAGTLPAERLVSHVLELDAIAKAFELMESGEALRVVLKP
ncbi:MAG: alcohol dehydrogenase catalytic domain-containing protein [Planctomycetota bacterium]|jgi:L-iditol 2-dehydrogenase